MDTDDDAILHLAKGQIFKGQITKSGIRYSYASVADTFFWGEKRQYLPSFQGAKRKNEAQNAAMPRGPHLIGKTGVSRKE